MRQHGAQGILGLACRGDTGLNSSRIWALLCIRLSGLAALMLWMFMLGSWFLGMGLKDPQLELRS